MQTFLLVKTPRSEMDYGKMRTWLRSRGRFVLTSFRKLFILENNIMRLLTVAGLLASALSIATPALASDINQLQALSQNEFKLFTEDLTAALSDKAMAPAAPLGITGFDLGIGVSVVKMQNSDLWKKASGSDHNYLPIPKLTVTKGLPFDIDIGAFYSAIPSTNIRLYGVNLKYAILPGSTVTPALALRGSYTKLSGVSQLGFSSQGVELLMSKGFVGFTPYGGVGMVHANAKPTVGGLNSESDTKTKLFAGLNWNILLGNFALEYDRTGNNDALSAKLGFRW